MPSIRTINYAAPPPGTFWAWSPEYDAVEWYNGTTLAMWPEIHGMLEFLGEDSGLPPLGAVLLILAACRDEWIELCIPFHGKVKAIFGATSSDAIPQEIKDTLVRGLKTVNDLPKDLRASFPAKCLLVSALFEGGPHSLPKDETRKILADLAIHGPSQLKDSFPQMDAKARFSRDVRALKTGLARHDAASLEARLLTGLENCQIQTPSFEDAPANGSRPLLERLASTGGECAAAAAIAKQTIAMMNFPSNQGSPDGLPVGGISDITNRGTIDRLLPGELAWDDVVLAVRLIHNEALYFRREMPPQDLAVSHTVLLDRGLRLWGTGRVLSLGVALGLRHHPALNRPGMVVECVAASSEGYDPLDLATSAGVYSALQPLIPAPKPDAFLACWHDTALAANDDTVPDVSFITAEAHLKEPSTIGLLGEIATWIHGKGGCFRVVTLDREGRFEVRNWSPSGNRMQFCGRIDLDEIFREPTKSPATSKVPQLRSKQNPLHELLPIYSLERLPILFPIIPQGSAILALDDSADSAIIGISNERQLMEWPKVGWGGQELLPKVPGRQHWMGRNDGGEAIVIASGRGAGESVRVFRFVRDILEEIPVCESKHPFPRFATVSGGAVLLAYSDSIEALSLSTGKRIAVLPINALPANPILDFDGVDIRLIDPGTEPHLPLKRWPFGDPSWPRMIVPDGVAIASGALCVRCAENIFGFSPFSWSWDKVKASSAHFTNFTESDFSPDPLTRLSVARLSPSIEVWLDSRNLLHLRNPADPGSTWSILLSSTKASVWHADWGLCSSEPRLRRPDQKEDSHFAHLAFRAFIKKLSGTK